VFVAGTGGFRLSGRILRSWAIDGAFGAISTSVAPRALKRPANGVGRPPKLSHGVPF
jgi:hypothetical protein